MRYAYLLGYLAGTALAAHHTVAADNARLRRDLARLEKSATWLARENLRLQAELDDSAEQREAAAAVLRDAVDDVIARGLS